MLDIIRIKKYIIRLIRKTKLGNEFLNQRSEKKRFELSIREFANGLMSDDKVHKYAIVVNDKNIRIVTDRLSKKLGRECEFLIVKTESDEGNTNNVPDEKRKIVCLKELSEYSNKKELKIVVPSGKTVVSDVERLLDAGFEWKQIVLDSEWQAYLGGRPFDAYDALLGYTRKDDLPGFKVFENELSDNPLTIVTLGSSTSDPYTCNLKSWPEYLFEMLTDMGISVKVLCGGMNSYHSRQEVLKVLRDVLNIKPDIVISYSGINDSDYFQRRHVLKEYPDVMFHQDKFLRFAMKKANKEGYFLGNVYHDDVDEIMYGIENTKNYSERWVDNERIMHALCNEFGITFYGFLQPYRDYGGYIKSGEPQKKSYEKNMEQNIKEINAWYDDVRQKIAEIEYIHDLSLLFDGMEKVYYDYCHVFEKGNKEIADAILSRIASKIKPSSIQ